MKISLVDSAAPMKCKVKDAPFDVWFFKKEHDRYGFKTRYGQENEKFIIWYWATRGDFRVTILDTNSQLDEHVEIMPQGFSIAFTNAKEQNTNGF